MTETITLNFILKDLQPVGLEVPKETLFNSLINPNIKFELAGNPSYEVKSDVKYETLKEFIDFSFNHKFPTVNSGNIGEFQELSKELGNPTNNVYFKSLEEKLPKDESLLQELIDDQECKNEAKLEELVAQHLSDYIDKYPDKLRKIPITRLYHIFMHPSRSLSNHDKAYDFITSSLKKLNEEGYENNHELCLLLQTLDGTKMSDSKIQDAFYMQSEHFNFIPSIPNNFLSQIKEKTDRFSEECHIMKKELDENDKKIQELIQNKVSAVINEFKEKFATTMENLIDTKLDTFSKQNKEALNILEKRLESLESNVDKLTTNRKSVNADIGTKFDKLNARVTQIDAEHNNLKREVERIGEANSKLNARVTQIDTERNNLKGEVERIGEATSKLKDRVAQTDAERNNLKGEVEKLKSDHVSIDGKDATLAASKPATQPQSDNLSCPLVDKSANQQSQTQNAQQSSSFKPSSVLSRIFTKRNESDDSKSSPNDFNHRLKGFSIKPQESTNTSASPSKSQNSSESTPPPALIKVTDPAKGSSDSRRETKFIVPPPQPSRHSNSIYVPSSGKTTSLASPLCQNDKQKRSFTRQRSGSINTPHPPKLNVKSDVFLIDRETAYDMYVNNKLDNFDASKYEMFSTIEIHIPYSTEDFFKNMLKSLEDLKGKIGKVKLVLDIVKSIHSNVLTDDILKNISSILITSDVEALPDRIFRNKKSIISVEINESLKNIPDYAFNGCSNLSEIVFTGVYMPTTYQIIGSNAFSSCGGLTEVNLPPSIKEIKDFGFDSCKHLKKVTFNQKPNFDISVGKYVFQKCEALEEVIFCSKVASIGACTFYKCTNLKTVTIPKVFLAPATKATIYLNIPGLTINEI